MPGAPSGLLSRFKQPPLSRDTIRAVLRGTATQSPAEPVIGSDAISTTRVPTAPYVRVYSPCTPAPENLKSQTPG
jgi:hypothetical protein